MVSIYNWLSKINVEKVLTNSDEQVIAERRYLSSIDATTKEISTNLNLMVQKLHFLTNNVGGRNKEEIMELYFQLEKYMDNAVEISNDLIIDTRLGKTNFTHVFNKIKNTAQSKETMRELQKNFLIETAIKNNDLDIVMLYDFAKEIFVKDLEEAIDHNKKDIFDVKIPYPHLQQFLRVVSRLIVKDLDLINLNEQEYFKLEEEYKNIKYNLN